MKIIPAASTLFLVALISSPLLAFAVESSDNTNGSLSPTNTTTSKPLTINRKPVTGGVEHNNPETKANCRELWYRDNNTPTCGKKTFCGVYMYQGLVTFPTEEACKALSGARKTSPDEENRVRKATQLQNKLRQASEASRIKENIAQYKNLIETRKTEAVENFKQQREALKAQIEKIKDEKKKALAERIDGKLAQINTNRTNEMSKHIEKMKELLGKIQTKADEVKAAGEDTSAVDAALKSAQTSVDKAAAAVATQVGKQYVATVSTEEGLKNRFGALAKQLEMDLKSVRQTLIEAQKAIANAARVLGQTKGMGISTPSAILKE